MAGGPTSSGSDQGVPGPAVQDQAGGEPSGGDGPPTLGKKLRTMRHEQGLTLAVLSAGAQLSVSYLNDVEHDRTLPRIGSLHRIAGALGTNVSDLLSGVDPFGL